MPNQGYYYEGQNPKFGTWDVFPVQAGRIPDISTANSSVYFVAPFRCRVKRFFSVINGAITDTAAVLTVVTPNGSISPTISIAVSGSADGVSDDSGDIADQTANLVEANTVIEISSGGQSTGTVGADITLLIQRVN